MRMQTFAHQHTYISPCEVCTPLEHQQRELYCRMVQLSTHFLKYQHMCSRRCRCCCCSTSYC